MSHFLHNAPCPRCRSRGDDTAGDNLAIYSDLHEWCYKCGFYKPPDKVHIIKSYNASPKNEYGLVYPEECEFTPETLAYLKRYGLTDEEIRDNLYGHQDGYVFKTSNFYLIRRLEKLPKVMTHGKVVGNEPIWLTKEPSRAIILVEDILSCIKVARVENSCALLKTTVHDVLISRLARQFDTCYCWLDSDMHKYMTRDLLPRLVPYFKVVRIIMSDADPKEKTTEEIRRYIYGD